MKMPSRPLFGLAAGSTVLALGAAALADVSLTTDVDLPVNSTAWKQHFAVDMVPQQPPAPDIAIEDPVGFTVTYKGKVAGFDIGRVFVEAGVGDNAYRIDYRLEQEGIARWFSEKDTDSVSLGTFQDGKLVSNYYNKKDYETEDDFQYVTMVRESAGDRFALWSNPAYDLYWPVPAELTRDAVDPVGALVSLGFTATGSSDPCDRTVPVYDGKKRWNMRTEYVGEERISTRSSKRYTGPAIKCQIFQDKIAGYKPEDLEESTPDGYMYLAPLPEAVRTENFSYIPVLLEGSYGIISASLEAKEPIITGPDGRVYEMWD